MLAFTILFRLCIFIVGVFYQLFVCCPQNVKLEPATQIESDVAISDTESTVAANVTVQSSNANSPVVITPMMDHRSTPNQQVTLQPNPLQAILGALQGQSGGLNIADYINAFVGQAAAQVQHVCIFIAFYLVRLFLLNHKNTSCTNSTCYLIHKTFTSVERFTFLLIQYFKLSSFVPINLFS